MIESTLASVQLVFAAGCSTSNVFFFLPPWYKYLLPDKMDPSTCNITDAFKFPADIWLIGLAVLDMLLRLAGFVAVMIIIVSGVMYITAQGSPEKAASARRRIYNALIGLAIALVATGFVAFVGNKLV